MSNLLSELCVEIDSLTKHVRWARSIHEDELACLYKHRIKKLLIKYESKENPRMQINEVAAELNAYKTHTDKKLETLVDSIIGIQEHIGSLHSKMNVIDKMQDDLRIDVDYLSNQIPTDDIRYKILLDAVRQIAHADHPIILKCTLIETAKIALKKIGDVE